MILNSRIYGPYFHIHNGAYFFKIGVSNWEEFYLFIYLFLIVETWWKNDVTFALLHTFFYTLDSNPSGISINCRKKGRWRVDKDGYKMEDIEEAIFMAPSKKMWRHIGNHSNLYPFKFPWSLVPSWCIVNEFRFSLTFRPIT
jgi:hypothetical protein